MSDLAECIFVCVARAECSGDPSQLYCVDIDSDPAMFTYVGDICSFLNSSRDL